MNINYEESKGNAKNNENLNNGASLEEMAQKIGCSKVQPNFLSNECCFKIYEIIFYSNLQIQGFQYIIHISNGNGRLLEQGLFFVIQLIVND